MFSNLFKKLKKNILYTRDNLLFFIKLIKFNFILNIVYFVFIYDILVYTDKNSSLFFIFAVNFFSFINPSFNTIIFMLFYFIISINKLLTFEIRNLFNVNSKKFSVKQQNFYILDSNNYNNVLLSYLYRYYSVFSIKIIFNYIFNFYTNFFSYILSKSFVASYIYNAVTKLFKVISWYPLFKRHSIFGFYRINRQRWVELKSEEVNYIKY